MAAKARNSGHVQVLHELRLDCDADVIVLMVAASYVAAWLATLAARAAF